MSLGKSSAKSDALWNEAAETLNNKGRHQLANMLAHGYEIKRIEPIVIIERGEDMYGTLPDGSRYKLIKTL